MNNNLSLLIGKKRISVSSLSNDIGISPTTLYSLYHELTANPDTGRKMLVYSEHVKMVEVLIKASDRLKARDLLGKYHKIFTDRVDINASTPIFIDTVGSNIEEREDAIKKIEEKHPNSTMWIDDIGGFDE